MTNKKLTHNDSARLEDIDLVLAVADDIQNNSIKPGSRTVTASRQHYEVLLIATRAYAQLIKEKV